MAAHHLFEAMKRQPPSYLVVNNIASTLGLAMLFNEMSRLVPRPARFRSLGNRNFPNVFDHPDLHGHDFKLIDDLLANRLFVAAADAGQFMFSQFVDGFDTRQIGWQWLALARRLKGATTLISVFVDDFGDASCFVAKANRGIAGSAVCSDIASKQTLANSAFFLPDEQFGLY